MNVPSIYKMPCPKCGGRITSTARMPDSTQAPTFCEAGHKFMRSEAYAKVTRPLQVEAATRLLADKADLRQRMADLRRSLATTPEGPEQDKVRAAIKNLREIMRTAV